MIQTLTLRLLALLAVAMPALAQDPEAYTAQTADPDIEVAELQRRIKPLLQEEVKVEADAWLQLLVAKNKQIAAAASDQTTAL
ncbi:MAG: hypothetical protein KAI24_11040, partial [Planctomycetes bacterium]|nr:hypothetical protein [Planctomycetota bacterium]